MLKGVGSVGRWGEVDSTVTGKESLRSLIAKQVSLG